MAQPFSKKSRIRALTHSCTYTFAETSTNTCPRTRSGTDISASTFIHSGCYITTEYSNPSQTSVRRSNQTTVQTPFTSLAEPHHTSVGQSRNHRERTIRNIIRSSARPHPNADTGHFH